MAPPLVPDRRVSSQAFNAPRASPDAFGAAQGRGLASAGQALEQVGARVSAQEDEYQRQVAAAQAKEADNAYSTFEREALYNPEDGYFNTNGRAAVDQRASIEERLQAKREELGAGLTGQAAQLFERVTSERANASATGILRHASAGQEKWMIDTSNARVSTFGLDAAAKFSDPGQVNLNIQSGRNEIAGMATQQGWSPETVALKQREFEDSVRGQVLERHKSLFTSQVNELQNGVYDDPDSYDAARKRFESGVDASAIPDIEKQAIKEAGAASLSLAVYRKQIEVNPSGTSGALGIASMDGAAEQLVRSVIGVESGGNPNAESPVGASGLMQVMPATGAEIAREIGDPAFPAGGTEAEQKAYLKGRDVSIRYGTHYLNKMLDRYNGDTAAALVAYNGGPARADEWLRSGRDDSVIPKESANYYKKVLAGIGAGASAVAAGSPVLQGHLEVAKSFLGAFEGRDFGALGEFIKKSAGIDIDPRQTAWCAAFVNGVLGASGIQGNGSLSAKSFLNYGEEVADPELGDIVVFDRGSDPTKGHVAFFAGYDANGNMRVLGGNQGKTGEVSIATYPKGSQVGFRRPPSVPNGAAADRELAKLPGGGPEGGLFVTGLDPRYAAIPFGQRLELQAQSRAAANQRQAQAQAAAKLEYAQLNDRMNLGIVTGDVRTEQAILSSGLDAGDMAARITQLRATMKEGSEADQAARDYLGGGLRSLNPFDAGDTTTAGKAYDTILKTMQAQPPEAQEAFTQAFIRDTRTIPASVVSSLRQGLASTDPASVSAALDRASQYQTLAPNALENVSNGGSVVADVASYQYLVNERGFSGADAAGKILERRSPEYKVNEERLGKDADKLIRDGEVSAAAVQSAKDAGWLSRAPGLGADPTTKNALSSEFEQAWRDNFIATGGDAEEATKRATAELSRVWGVTEVSGEKQLMKFPPEKRYPPVDGGFSYLREDMEKTAQEAASVGEGGPENVKVGNVWLRPAKGTAAAWRAGRLPHYQLFYEHEQDGQTIIEQVPGFWGMTPEGLKEQTTRGNAAKVAEAETQRAVVEEALEGSEIGIRDMLMEAPEDVPAPPVDVAPQPAPVAQAGKAKRRRAGAGIVAPVADEEPDEFVDPALTNKGLN